MAMAPKINKIPRKSSLKKKETKNSKEMMIQMKKTFKKMTMIKVKLSKKATIKK